MASSIEPSITPGRADPVRRASVFLPKEHGSWSLALEPVLFGLLVAPTLAGGALAVGAVSAFFLRRPLKAASRSRSRADLGTVALLGTFAAAGLVTTVVLGGWRPLLPLIPALPLALLFLHWDRQNETRATQAELAASSIFALLPSVMAMQATMTIGTAIALSTIMLARSAPTILIVRTYLRLRKGQHPSLAPAVVTTLAAALLIIMMAARQWVPWVAAGLVLASALRLALLVPALRPDWPARRLGIGEMIFGVIYVVTISVSLNAGHLPS